jgi:hypothetical protein
VDEPQDDKIDWAETVLDVGTKQTTKTDYKFEKVAGYPIDCPPTTKPEGALIETIVVDPLLGPVTEAFFDEVEIRFQLQPEGVIMGQDTSRQCDFDGDGNCDETDRAFFAGTVGACRGEGGYHPLADGNADGCITTNDSALVFTCGGDCGNDGVVTVDELLTMVNIALSSSQLWTCPAGDADHSGDITINEIIQAVGFALNNCPGY